MGQITRRRRVEAGGAALASAYAIGGRREAGAVSAASYALPGLSAPGEILVDRWGIRDLIGRWAKGRPVPLLFSRGRIEQATESRISLVPAR